MLKSVRLTLACPLLVLLAVPALADETRQVPAFTGVEVGSIIRARIDAGPAGGPIVLGGPAELLARVRTEVRDGTLMVSLEPETRVPEGTQITLSLRMPRADRLGVSGASQLAADVPSGETLALAASGAGQLRLSRRVSPRALSLSASGASSVTVAGVETSDAQLQLSGAARVTLAGRAAAATLAISGGSELDAAGLAVDRATATCAGGSLASLRAVEVSAAELSGGAELRVPASARLGAVASSGGARLVKTL